MSPPPSGSSDDLALLGRIVCGVFSRPTYSDAPSFAWFVPLLLALPVAICFAVYESLRRRARYREQRAFLETKLAFLDELARPGARAGKGGGERHQALLAGFTAAVRAAEREALERWEAERDARPGAAFFSPRASARRRRWLRRRSEAWIRWADAACAASDRGESPPPEPGARKRAGAPIRRLCRHSVNPMPAPGEVIAAFEAARGRGRVAEKIRCGSLLLDAEARVDSSLVRNAGGEIVGRKPGLRGWLDDAAPQLLAHYATLMKYRRLAQAFRAAHGVGDPCPAALLLEDGAPAALPDPMRRRLAAAREHAKAVLASPAARTLQDFRQALARREWRRTA